MSKTRPVPAMWAYYGGVVHEIRGDALVAEFARVLDAVDAVLCFQQVNTGHNAALRDDIIPEIRVGIGLREIVVADKTATGEGVVLAQRVEQPAPIPVALRADTGHAESIRRP